MHLKFAASLLALAALASPLGALPQMPPKVAIAIELKRELADDHTKHSDAAIRAAIQPADVNGDGIRDWQVDFNAFGAAWCGTGGCRYQLWLGRRTAKPLLVFDRQMRSVSVERRGTRNVYVFDFHGSECGGFGSQECPGEFTWDAGRERMVLLTTPRKHTSNADPIDYD